MERMLHYTSEFCWREIQTAKALLPLSRANCAPAPVPAWVESAMGNQTYVVGIPPEGLAGWDSCGMLEYLLQFTSGELLLSVPILTEGGFVRDHVHGSPQQYLELYGVDFCKARSQGEVDRRDPRIMGAAVRYYDSTVPLDQYKGDYVAPEFWLPQTTPVNMLIRL